LKNCLADRRRFLVYISCAFRVQNETPLKHQIRKCLIPLEHTAGNWAMNKGLPYSDSWVVVQAVESEPAGDIRGRGFVDSGER